jgi:hypothetical protein
MSEVRREGPERIGALGRLELRGSIRPTAPQWLLLVAALGLVFIGSGSALTNRYCALG